jgi:O-antigen/teichoic acid export membrane protein
MAHPPSQPERPEAPAPSTASSPQLLARGLRSLSEGVGRIASSARLRGEIGWVVAHRSIEFVLLFALLKVLTNALGKEGYGEYNLAETALLLIGSILIVPMFEAYKRDYFASREADQRRDAAIALLRWYTLVTLIPAAALALSSESWAQSFGIGKWTALAAGLVFFGERWRLLGHEWLNLERKRRVGALWNIGFLTSQITLIAAALSFGPATAATALLAYAFTSLIFGALVAGPTARELLRLPGGARSRVRNLVLSFGVPFSVLQLLQWVQTFSDRYMVKGMLDPASVGLYVAAFQVCGIPFMLGQRIGHELVIPIAYQRGRDAADPAQLWSADRVLIAGLGAQFAIGLGMLAGYVLFGSRLLVLLTSDDYALPTATIATLAAARFAQAMSLGLQPIFAVHQRMRSLLWFRIAGAILTPVVCWFTIPAWGVAGAAVGTLLSFLAYSLLLAFGPGGGLWLVTDARRRARDQDARAPR